jgi:PHD/YefM family antitoxin component YafN of YafNO toxin-antitoxin module
MPPFSITVTGDSPNELRENLRRALNMVSTGGEEVAATAEPQGKAKRKAAEPATAPAAAPATAATVVPGAMTQADVRKKLQEVVKRFGNDKCSEILLKHGAPNLGAITADRYEAVVADAEAALASGADPLG